MQTIKTFLMFTGQAEEAMNFYTSLFDNSSVISLTRYKAGEAGKEGTVAMGVFSLHGIEFMCTDTFIEHGFTFTSSMSFFVDFETEEELGRVFSLLSNGGQIMMPLSAYPFSKLFGWISDRYGVSWQLNLKI